MSNPGLLPVHQVTFPTTAIQRAYFVGRESALPLGGVNCVGYMEFAGLSMDIPALNKAIEQVAKYAVLRTQFLDRDRLTFRQEISPELRIHHVDKINAAEHRQSVRERMLATSVDLTAGKLWEVEVTLWQGGGTTLHIAVSLAVLDLPGLGALMHHLARCYHGALLSVKETSAEIWSQQVAYSAELVRKRQQRSRRKEEKLAQGRMQTLPPPPVLPFTSFTPANENSAENGKMVRRSRFYTAQQWGQLKQQTASYDIAPAAMLLALYARALRLCSTIPEFIITVTNVYAKGSELQLAERTVTYAHRARPAVSFEALLRDTYDDLRYRLLRGMESETELRAALVDKVPGHSGLSPYVFTYAAQTPVIGELATYTFGQSRLWGQTPQAVIDFQVFRLSEDQIEVAFDVRRAAIEPDIDSTIFALLTESIDDIIAGRVPENCLPQEMQKWRGQINATPAACPPAMLFSAFRHQVKQQPDAVAIISHPDSSDLDASLKDPLSSHLTDKWLISYAALDRLACQLASKLSVKTAPGDVVGIRLPKGPAQIVAVLATLYAGCTYLPLGLDIPEERLETIRQRASMRYLITTAEFQQLEDSIPLAQPRMREGVGTTPEVSPDSLAYIIFTSGSTGIPKGVSVSHRAANNTITDINQRHYLDRTHTLLAVSALDFDLSVYDIFGPLSCGGKIVTINENERRDAFRWAELVRLHQVSVWNSVPALISMLLAAEDNLPSVRIYFCSGDWISPELFSQLYKASPGSRLVAMGGSTEAAIWSNEYVIRNSADLPPHWPSVPYGLPLSGQQYRVVRDVSGVAETAIFEDCVDGMTGELWIGGVGLAEGYIGDAQRTAERFVMLPEKPGDKSSRWYRTGDLGYWRNGLLFFVGRLDTQVKIQGHRVECGEIEQILRTLPEIRDAVVVPINERRALGAVIITNAQSISSDALRQRLVAKLPHYMIPSSFLVREQLYLSANGKIDRKWAQEQLDRQSLAIKDNTTNNAIAAFEACQQIWSLVLKRDSVGAMDNFFALGGDSLAATRVCALLMEKGIQITVAAMFAAGTLEQFARQCHYVVSRISASVTTKDYDEGAPFPLTPLQRAYALGADGIKGVSRCDTVFAVIIRSQERYSPECWQRALEDIIRATPALRLVRKEEQQQVIDPCPLSLLTLPAQSRLEKFLAETPLDAGQRSPLRLVTVDGEPTRMGLIMNYLTLDALSLVRIIHALIRRVAGQPPETTWDTHTETFACYADKLAKRESDAIKASWPSEDWQPPSLPNPVSFGDRNTIKALTHRLDGVLRGHLESIARARKITLSALILTAFSHALAQLCRQRQIVLVVPVSWRPPEALQALGHFTQLRLCRCLLGDSPEKVSAALADAVAGNTPDEGYIARQGRASYPFVFTSTVGVPEVESLYRGAIRIEWSHTRTPGVVIDCQVLPDGNGLEVRWDYAEGIIDETLLMQAYEQFITRLTIAHDATEGRPASPPSMLSCPASFSRCDGNELALRAIMSALPQLHVVPARLIPVVAAWQQLPQLDAEEEWQEIGLFLAQCVDGRRAVNELLTHPVLAPEQLLLSSLRQIPFCKELMSLLHAESLQRKKQEQALHILVLGAGLGTFSEALMQMAREQNLSLKIDDYENSALLNQLAQRDVTVAHDPVPEVIITPATLHRDLRLLRKLRELLPDKTAVEPVKIYVLEVTAPDAASLVAAVLEPSIVDSAHSPLLPAQAWWQHLEQAGATVKQMQRLTPHLICLHAEMAVSAAQTQVSCNRVLPAKTVCCPDLMIQVAQQWQSVLGLAALPDKLTDFFAVGGDSLRATQIITALRNKGFSSVRLADLFNQPVLEDFVSLLSSQEGITDEVREENTQNKIRESTIYPLTDLQLAYLSGRSHEQLLGGAASHCYFEFIIAEKEGIDLSRWQEAIRQVVARHDALRSRVTWHEGKAVGEVCAQAGNRIEITPAVRASTEAEVPDPAIDFPLRIRVTPDGRTIGIGMDNLMLDGASMWRVMRELGACYRGDPVSQIPVMTYAQYRRQQPASEDNETVMTMPPAPALPYAIPVEAVSNPRFERCSAELEEPLWQRVKTAAASAQVTSAALLLGAYAIEIARLADGKAFSVNVTTFERDLRIPDVNQMVGDFTRLGLVAFGAGLPANGDADERQALLQQARIAQKGLLILHDTPLQVSTLRVARETVRARGKPLAGLFPVVFTCGLGLDASPARSDDFGFGTILYARSQTPQVTLDFQVHDDLRGLHITADYLRVLLSAAQVTSVTQGVVSRLARFAVPARDPVAPPSELVQGIEQVWRRLLKQGNHQPPGNFFQDGGDSLLATRCIRQLQESIDPRISLRLLLIHPQFTDFCQEVARLVVNGETENTDPVMQAKTYNCSFEEGVL